MREDTSPAIEVTTRAQANATIEARVNAGLYASVTSGSASAALALNVGTNTVDVRVTAQDGITQKTYTVTVTRQAAPTVTSPTVASITATGATLGGSVTADGGATITERGVVYSPTATNADPLIGGLGVVKVVGTGTTGVFTVPVSGLTASTGYSYKAYAINSQGTSYSGGGTFVTFSAQQSWRQTHFGSAANTGNAADNADPDNDGLSNLLEYALNLPPKSHSRLPANVKVAGGNLEYSYTRSTAAFSSGTSFQVEWSDNLVTCQPPELCKQCSATTARPSR